MDEPVHATLVSFEPTTEGQKLVHAETLRVYNHMIDARRLRLGAVLTRLPDLLWAVMVAGAAISLTSVFFFQVEDARLHGVLTLLLAGFIGLIMLITLALARPFHGELGIGPAPYELVYEQLMNP